MWPEKYLPGTTDNFVSNEVIVKGITASRVWELLDDPGKWESYYDNVGEITPPNSGRLGKYETFSFATFGLPPLSAECLESIPPGRGRGAIGRLAWRAWRDGDRLMRSETLDFYHGWIVEDLGDERVRILTQQSQIGGLAAKLAVQHPNVILNEHQSWLEGLVRAARDEML